MGEVLSFDAVRAQRAEVRETAIEAGEAIARALANDVVALALAASNRAFAASGPVFGTDPELARIINRAVARNMRATIRRTLSPVTTPAVRAELVDLATQAFFERLHRLMVASEGKTAGCAP